ncbi:hypothetical protein SNEBB_004626 [Seison nebaliae]|nr:hypothetical protein SNEBB_004626 [Seison nebaliae]
MHFFKKNASFPKIFGVPSNLSNSSHNPSANHLVKSKRNFDTIPENEISTTKQSYKKKLSNNNNNESNGMNKINKNETSESLNEQSFERQQLNGSTEKEMIEEKSSIEQMWTMRIGRRSREPIHPIRFIQEYFKRQISELSIKRLFASLQRH